MYWNHRIIKRVEGEGTQFEEDMLYIVEMFYDSDSHQMIGWSEKEYVYGSSIDELRQSLHWMLDALDKPVLDEKELLAEAAIARENGEEDLWPEERLSIDEVLDSLGLEREDIESWEDEGGAV